MTDGWDKCLPRRVTMTWKLLKLLDGCKYKTFVNFVLTFTLWFKKSLRARSGDYARCGKDETFCSLKNCFKGLIFHYHEVGKDALTWFTILFLERFLYNNSVTPTYYMTMEFVQRIICNKDCEHSSCLWLWWQIFKPSTVFSFQLCLIVRK